MSDEEETEWITLAHATAEELAKGRLDRRRKYTAMRKPSGEVVACDVSGRTVHFFCHLPAVACSGCHETNEGHEISGYPRDKKTGMQIGTGCEWCGYTGKSRQAFMCPAETLPPRR